MIEEESWNQGIIDAVLCDPSQTLAFYFSCYVRTAIFLITSNTAFMLHTVSGSIFSKAWSVSRKDFYKGCRIYGGNCQLNGRYYLFRRSNYQTPIFLSPLLFFLTFLLWKAPLSVTLCPLYYNIFVLFINSCLRIENMIVVLGKESEKHKLFQWKFSEHLLCARPWVRCLGTDMNKTQCLSLWISGPSWEIVT